MDAGIPKGATGQREYTDLEHRMCDSSEACGLRIGRDMGFGDDKGYAGEETSTTRRNEKRRGRYR